MRLGGLEFRQVAGERSPEIVKWNPNPAGKEYCYTIMWFERDSEGYYAKFVGSRPFEIDDDGTLWALMRYADAVLTARWKLEMQFPEGFGETSKTL